VMQCSTATTQKKVHIFVRSGSLSLSLLSASLSPPPLPPSLLPSPNLMSPKAVVPCRDTVFYCNNAEKSPNFGGRSGCDILSFSLSLLSVFSVFYVSPLFLFLPLPLYPPKSYEPKGGGILPRCRALLSFSLSLLSVSSLSLLSVSPSLSLSLFLTPSPDLMSPEPVVPSRDAVLYSNYAEKSPNFGVRSGCDVQKAVECKEVGNRKQYYNMEVIEGS
jgi:hypothetical protein